MGILEKQTPTQLMYKESYIQDGPEGHEKYDHILGAGYKIKNGKRIYREDYYPVPPETEKPARRALINIRLLPAVFLAVFITALYLIFKTIAHV
jgi:hypothetical protein